VQAPPLLSLIVNDQEEPAAVINTQIEESQIIGVRASVTSESVTINISGIQFLPDSDVLTEPCDRQDLI
jgi:hypothetical protein